jgi:hypothetical protein
MCQRCLFAARIAQVVQLLKRKDSSSTSELRKDTDARFSHGISNPSQDPAVL